MASIDYAAVCEAIEQRPSLSVWPNVRRLAKNRVDVAAYQTTVKLPLLVATRLSAEEAQEGPQVLEILVEIFDVVADTVADRVDLAEPALATHLLVARRPDRTALVGGDGRSADAW